MKVVIQRVSSASVLIEEEKTSSIQNGLLILLGVSTHDTDKDAEYLVNKIINLRIFSDSNENMNLSIKDVSGSILIISQFTLYGSCKKGRRPSFQAAANPDLAKKLYLYFIELIKKTGIDTQTGKFKAKMDITLTNNGPATFILES